ncbi:alkaline phosphatase D family protein [Pseudorhodoferax soli]|uniref:Cholesterol oxidase n=1 Tax=Pseudorhodoferax soli TaxID=545864 RepID=A0A368XRT9_9BURK|nr:alkaline phosphatase D family protein [Pseudorhodoferax soli]RCW70239.1 choline dehydrogenase-like flavoprotein [Pseudorhodoferax soli]
MHPGVGWLSRDAHALQIRLKEKAMPLHCDLLIVGSGYGGAVAAARMAGLQHSGKPLRVLLVERGREYLPGMFPSRTGDLPGHVRFSQQDGKPPRGPATALWDLRLGPDVNVVQGSGLGGGSLINAAVMERPEPAVWQSVWPPQIDGGQLDGAYRKVETMLQSAPLPAGQQLHKLSALQHLGDGLPGAPRVQRCNLAVAFSDARTPAGVEQKACIHCGDCATGCNHRAKNSLDVNYLAQAKRRGVDMYCGVLALRIERLVGSEFWQVRWVPTDRSRGWAGEAEPIRTRFLIISAGSLGSTELLQRSELGMRERARDDAGQSDSGDKSGSARRARLRFSEALGSRFSTNGDMLAAAVKLPVHTQICAEETAPAKVDGKPARHIGPTITGMLRSGAGSSRFTAQEFAIPAALRTLLAELTGTLDMLHAMPRFDWSLHSPHQRGDDPLSPGQAALDRTMVYGLMGDDGAGGRLEPTRRPSSERGEQQLARQLEQTPPLEEPFDGRIAVQWPDARHATVFDAQHAALGKAYGTRRRGWYLPNPAWRPLPQALDRLAQGRGVRGPVTTVHPLGGCPMGESIHSGVTDWAGCVFNADGSSQGPGQFHHGLAVLDGSIVPRALGINPALTIAALAEHAIPALQQRWEIEGEEHADAAEPSAKFARPVWSEPVARPLQPATAARLLERAHGALEIGGERYWGAMQVHFAPIEDVAAFARTLPRRVAFERVVLYLYPDRGGLDDDPQWRAQRDVEVTPLWEVTLSGEADVLFRHWSWGLCRVWRSWVNLGSTNRIGGTAQWWPPRAAMTSMRALLQKVAIASNIGEQRGIDYLLHVDCVSGPNSPLQPGDRLRGRKLIDNSLDSNPWRQVSEMRMELVRSKGILRPALLPLGTLSLDLRYFVRHKTALLAMQSQPDMVTALADLGSFALMAARVLLKIQLLKFVPPEKRDRSIKARRPAELPGLSIQRYDLRPQRKVLLTRYHNEVEPPLGPPIVLLHGFTASGSTFAHPSMPRNLVQYLCGERRDVWVVELPTSIAFAKREAVDQSFEDVAEHIPFIVRRVLSLRVAEDKELGRPPVPRRQMKVDVLAHCIGAAMFCRAVLRRGSPHQRVRSLTLSQVGPLIQMSPANLLRGYLASYLAQFLGVDSLDARPSFAPGGANSLGQTLLDAVLASLPYPARDHEQELAAQAVAQGRPDFRLVRHRADAMLGRLFELTPDSPVSAAMLDALDDILGYARVRTLAQIIHYTQHAMLTDDDGRNRDLHHDALSRRMGFPVLMLHGRRSGVFDWRGSMESYLWLRDSHAPRLDPALGRVVRDAERLHLGLDTPRQLCIFEKFGHQDTIIGSRAPDVVYPVVGDFLRWVAETETCPLPPLPSPTGALQQAKVPASSPAPGVAVAQQPARPWVAVLPWIGPVLGWLREAPQDGWIKVSFLLRPNPTHARTSFVGVVPMRLIRGQWVHPEDAPIILWEASDSELPIGDVLALRLMEMAKEPPPIVFVTEPAAQRRSESGDDAEEEEEDAEDAEDEALLPDIGPRLRAGAVALDIDPAWVDGVNSALLLLTVHDDMPKRPRALTEEDLTWLTIRSRRASRHAISAVRRFLADPPQSLESALLRVPASLIAARDLRTVDVPAARTSPLHVAICSCQYPGGLLDQDLAQASLARLAQRLRAPSDKVGAAPQLLLQLGDQVYVDETAGLFDPVTAKIALEQIYDRTQGASAAREVFARVPSYCMLDDHEVRDNWQRGQGSADQKAEDDRALMAFRERQASLNPPFTYDCGSASFQAAPGGWPLFVLDTRTRRDQRSPQTFLRAHIAPLQELDRLLAWLGALNQLEPTCPKFVATPSVILPLLRSAPGEVAWSDDGWAGYPASQAHLLGEIARQRIRNVVFLSGDAHLSMLTKMTIAWEAQQPVTVRSIVSSGLYAPWRFANAEPANYCTGAFACRLSDASRIHGESATTFHQADGFAVISAVRGRGGYQISVDFDLADGRHSTSWASDE